MMTLVAVAIGLCWVTSAAEPDAEEGFTTVFNGKDLSGWIGATEAYTVVDGLLSARSNKGGHLMLEKQYANFILRFDYLMTTNGNNGVMLRMTKVHGTGTECGMEVQILDDHGGKHKNLKDWQYNGCIYGVAVAKSGHEKPMDQWNAMEVRAVNSQITVTLNGTVIVDVDLAGIDKMPDGKEHPSLLNPKGYLGLAAHWSRVDFRNIRIKELP